MSMKTNIVFICELDNYSKNVAKLLSEKLEMFYVSVDEMVEFELGDEQHILKTLGSTAGQKYIEDCEDRVVKNVAGFENTVICINPATMFTRDNLEKLKETSYTVYLQISPQYFPVRAKFSNDAYDKEFNDISFTDRDKMYVDSSDIVLNCCKYKENKASKKLIKVITKYFKKLIKEKKAQQVKEQKEPKEQEKAE